MQLKIKVLEFILRILRQGKIEEMTKIFGLEIIGGTGTR
jgi:hypothetical protein